MGVLEHLNVNSIQWELWNISIQKLNDWNLGISQYIYNVIYDGRFGISQYKHYTKELLEYLNKINFIRRGSWNI